MFKQCCHPIIGKSNTVSYWCETQPHGNGGACLLAERGGVLALTVPALLSRCRPVLGGRVGLGTVSTSLSAAQHNDPSNLATSSPTMKPNQGCGTFGSRPEKLYWSRILRILAGQGTRDKETGMFSRRKWRKNEKMMKGGMWSGCKKESFWESGRDNRRGGIAIPWGSLHTRQRSSYNWPTLSNTGLTWFGSGRDGETIYMENKQKEANADCWGRLWEALGKRNQHIF